jgi:hypothetical protein
VSGGTALAEYLDHERRMARDPDFVREALREGVEGLLADMNPDRTAERRGWLMPLLRRAVEELEKR